MSVKVCPVCKTEKEVSAFYFNKKLGYHTAECRPCYSVKQRLRALEKKYHLKNYDLTPEGYYERLKQQDGKCAICGKDHREVPEKKWGRAQLAVDHDHGTGVVRGLLCHACNLGLGYFRDDPERLISAVEYLKKAA